MIWGLLLGAALAFFPSALLGALAFEYGRRRAVQERLDLLTQAAAENAAKRLQTAPLPPPNPPPAEEPLSWDVN